ncbi:MAG: single-stranded DNA-binding protein [Erysipelotrichaceae bacterium]|nr:single-stranded DNA-binding protein [Erysipelotrichaceae bacterium]
MINRVVLVGRMTRDPELRRTQNGTPVTSFTLAMNRNFSSANGERQTDFINCVVWNKAAENVERYCFKGSLVGVEGRLQSRQYDAQDGRKVTVVEVVCDSVQFLESKGSRERTQPQIDTSSQSFYMNQTPPPSNDFNNDFDNLNNAFDIMDDDIQF